MMGVARNRQIAPELSELHTTLCALEAREVNWHALTDEYRAHLDRVDKPRQLLTVRVLLLHPRAGQRLRRYS